MKVGTFDILSLVVGSYAMRKLGRLIPQAFVEYGYGLCV